ncbi:hypothetical protein ACIPJG_32625 [Streptomyces halstedii]|uniref:hypothetical protein n=1 Tax=Streptomyces halstedii TaxID=1944 RepID=UPI00380CC455
MTVSPNLLSANTSGIETDTSGWTAGANTTLSHSTRFYQGARSLAMTATAAGSVTATTAARVPVTAGQEYTGYALLANVVAAAGRVGTMRVDWYAAVTGGTSLGSMASAGVTLVNSTAWNAPPPIPIGTAPAGAAYASVTLTVTGLTAGAAVLADTIGFGPPNSPIGNLLPYNTSSVEVSNAGWAAWGNVTLGRATTAYEGWYSLQATSAAAGEVQVGMGANVPTVPGAEFLGSAMVRPVGAAVSGTEVRVELRWYDEAGTYLTSSPSTAWTPVADEWTYIATIGVAPPGAVNGRLRLRAAAGAAGQVWLFDRMTLAKAPLPAGSLITYNTQSMEVDVSGWTAVSGCTISRSTTYAYEGSASLLITPTTTGDAVISTAAPVPVTPRQAYVVTTRIRVGPTTGRTLSTRLVWVDAAGADMRSTTLQWHLNASGGGWYTIPSSAAAPDGAAAMRFVLTMIDAPAGDQIYVDAVTMTPGGIAAIADPIPDKYGASIALQGLTAGGYANWGLWRVEADGNLTPVRGESGDTSQNTVVGDRAVIEDYEAPLGIPVSYYLKLWTTSATGNGTMSDPITIPEPLPTEIVLKDPGMPARQTTAVVAKGGQPTWTRKARQSVNAVRGRVRPIVISDMRTSREGTLTLVTETAEELDAMWWLLEAGTVLLIQWPSLWGEKDVYVSVGDVSEAPVVEYAEYRDRDWSVPLTEVDRPIGGATGSAGRTWQTVLTDHPDAMSVLTTYRSWLGVYTGVGGT